MDSKVIHTYNDHLIDRQNRAEKEMLDAFEAAQPDLDNARVVVNPYLINPLCAMILFKTAEPCVPTLTIHGKRNAREDITHTLPRAQAMCCPWWGCTKASRPGSP